METTAAHLGGDFLTAGKAESLLLAKPVPGAGVDGDRGMQMGIAKERPGWIGPTGIGLKFHRALSLGDAIFGWQGIRAKAW